MSSAPPTGSGCDTTRDEALVFAALIGVESLIVNQGIKRLLTAAAPPTPAIRAHPCASRRTSSFPSGHASSAAFAATLLTVWAAPVMGAAVVHHRTSSSPPAAPYVRIHHASDVVAGAIVGLVLAQVVLAVGGADVLPALQ